MSPRKSKAAPMPVDWTVTRIVREKFAVEAVSRDDAMSIADAEGDPYEVTIIRQSAKRDGIIRLRSFTQRKEKG